MAAAIAALVALRLIAAAALPLSFDEAYYWLWSKHLAAGYYDHPPLIAFAIRAGTILCGDTPLGVRLLPVLFSAIASWAVWRLGERIGGEDTGATAALLFNLMPMTSIEMLTATPDAPLMLFSALFVWALAAAVEDESAAAWVAAGIAGGLALLSKYTALFLGAGAIAVLLALPKGRRALATPWPWLAAAIALALFAPNIWWNARHGWISYRFQFGKAGASHFAPYHLAEFIGAQLALATPFLAVLAAYGLRRNRLLLLLFAPALAFFTVHSLSVRIEGNWPSFLYPALAVAAALAMADAKPVLARWSRIAAVPLALFMLAGLYMQALFAPLPVEDPTARLLAYGFADTAHKLARLQQETGAEAFAATDYATAAWLAFYTHAPVIQLDEPQRWSGMPPADGVLRKDAVLYVAEPRRDLANKLARDFRSVQPIAALTRRRDGMAVGNYDVSLLRHGGAGLSAHVVNGDWDFVK